ncbi:ERI1 exoribonuclease 3-like isoform X2 [Apostichopus japonicus]
MSVSVGRSLIFSSRLLNLSVLRYSVTTDCGRKLFSPQSFSMASSIASANIAAQDFHDFLVLDFEATCIRNGRLAPQEIIEFPVLKVSGRTFEVESEFHTYVEPQVHEVGEFCTELTGITKEMVAGKPHLPDVLEMFHDWMQKEDLLSNETKSIFVTCGDWDLKTMLPGQCDYCKLPIKPYFNQWINIKKPFARVTGEYPKSMMAMLERLDLKHVGRHHSGLDDCKNIAKILKAIAERKFRFIPTGAKR